MTVIKDKANYLEKNERCHKKKHHLEPHKECYSCIRVYQSY